MDLHKVAYDFNVKAFGFERKVAIIHSVSKELGYEGVEKLAPLVGYTPERLIHFAQLDKYFEDRKRGRHQRKPKPRLTAGEAISPQIYKELLRWTG